MKKNKMIWVKWVDANEMQGWAGIEEVKLDVLPVVDSIGFLFSDDEEKIILVSSHSNFDAYIGRLAIPKGCVKSIRELRVK